MHFSLYVLTHVKVFLSGLLPEIALSVNPFVSDNCYSRTSFPGRVLLFETYFTQLTIQFLCLFKLKTLLLKPCQICASGWVNLFFVCLHFRTLCMAKTKMSNSGKKPYQCKTCDQCFAKKGNLQRHERSHTRGKPYQCKTCDKCFHRQRDLEVHERSHTGEKPYQCKSCDKWFSDKRNLHRHERSHTGEKPYQCKACDKWFTQKGTLQRHEKLHSGQQPFSSDYDETFTCWICQEELSSASQLINHYDEHMKVPWLYCWYVQVYLI